MADETDAVKIARLEERLSATRSEMDVLQVTVATLVKERNQLGGGYKLLVAVGGFIAIVVAMWGQIRTWFH